MRVGSLVRDVVGDIGVILCVLPLYRRPKVAKVKFIIGDTGTYTLSLTQFEVLCE